MRQSFALYIGLIIHLISACAPPPASPSALPPSLPVLLEEILTQCTSPDALCAPRSALLQQLIYLCQGAQHGHRETYRQLGEWGAEGIRLALGEGGIEQRLGLRILRVILDALKYHQFPARDQWLEQLEREILSETRGELWRVQLLPLLSRYREAQFWPVLVQLSSTQEPTLREVAWRERLRCIELGCPLEESALRALHREEERPPLRGIAVELAARKTPLLVHRWCGARWWSLDTADSCRRALLKLGDERSFRKLSKWLDALFRGSLSSGHAERELVAALHALIPLVSDAARALRYGALLHRFFELRRNLEGALKVVELLERFPDRRSATESAQLLLTQALKVPQHPNLIRALRQKLHRLQSPL